MRLDFGFKAEVGRGYDQDQQPFGQCLETDCFAWRGRYQVEGTDWTNWWGIVATYRRCVPICSHNILFRTFHRCLPLTCHQRMEREVHLAFNPILWKLFPRQYTSNPSNHPLVGNVGPVKRYLKYRQWCNCNKMPTVAIVHRPSRVSPQMDKKALIEARPETDKLLIKEFPRYNSDLHRIRLLSVTWERLIEAVTLNRLSTSKTDFLVGQPSDDPCRLA